MEPGRSLAGAGRRGVCPINSVPHPGGGTLGYNCYPSRLRRALQMTSLFNDHADLVVAGSHAQKCESRRGRVEELGVSCRAASGGTQRLFVISICTY